MLVLVFRVHVTTRPSSSLTISRVSWSGVKARPDGFRSNAGPLPASPKVVVLVQSVLVLVERSQTEMRLLPYSATKIVFPSADSVTAMGVVNWPTPDPGPEPNVVRVLHPGTGVGVLVDVLVGVDVGVLVGVFVAVLVGVLVGVFVAVLVGVLVGVYVAVLVAAVVGVEVGEIVRVAVGVEEGVLVAVTVGVWVGVLLAPEVGVLVGLEGSVQTPLVQVRLPRHWASLMQDSPSAL